MWTVKNNMNLRCLQGDVSETVLPILHGTVSYQSKTYFVHNINYNYNDCVINVYLVENENIINFTKKEMMSLN